MHGRGTSEKEGDKNMAERKEMRREGGGKK